MDNSDSTLRWRRASLATAAVSAVALCVPALAEGATVAPSPKLSVIATGLNNPRKIFVGPSGAVYVVEAGKGGPKCLGKGENATCVGNSASIAEIQAGKVTQVVTGLLSGASPNGQQGEGPSDVVVRGNTFYILMQDVGIDSKGQNPLGAAGSTLGTLLSTPAGAVAPTELANLAAFEAAHDPDHGAGPGAAAGDPPIDSDPYAVVAYHGGWAVADAAGNDLLWISPKGAISVLAVFPVQSAKLTPAIDKELGVPSSLKSILVQSVPTSIAEGPDGALYVGELTGAPFTPGSARIWRVMPGQKTTLYAKGFTNISDLAFDGPDLLVLEMDTMGLLDQNASGALISLSPDKTETTLASAGLVTPTGLAIGNGLIYISNFGIFPGSGAAPHGEVVTIPAPKA